MIVARFAGVGEVLDDAGSSGLGLTGAEVARRDRLRFAVDRDAYTAAHLLVRVCAGELLGLPPARLLLEQHCPRCGRAGHGRPSISGEPAVWVSLSHTRGQVAAVAASEPCGIDVQTLASSIPRMAVTARERAWLDARPDPLPAFTRLWVRKEALVKAGVADDPGGVDVLAASGPADRYGDLALTEWVGNGVRGCVAVRDAS